MPNFCPDCGTKLATPNPNFCPNCGKVLGQKKVDKQKSSPPQACAPSVHELGTKLEKCVEEILIGMGFQTEWRQRIRGTSGVLHEIDVVAKKGKTFWAVECKNWKCPVGKELIGGFHSKLQDLGSNWNGIFVSYQGFTEPAEEYAEQFNIKRWDTDHLKEEWLAVSIGRAEYATIGKKITVKNALPLRVDFSQASKINLLNGNKTSASGLLSYTPYYSVDYSYHAAFKDPTREKHTFNDSGKVFVNALDCSVLNPPLRSTSTLKRTLNLVLSKDARQNAKRTTKLLEDLLNGVSDKEYELAGKEQYTIRILEPVITPNTAKKEATHFVITENTETIKYCTQDGTQNSVTYTPKTKDIIIKCVTLVNLPRWDITFNVFNKSYSREMLAHSGAILEDSIQYCPKHTSPFKRETVAACEVCGQALCNSHVSQCPVCGKWLCQDDGVSCSSCGKTFCPEHISLVCGICNKPLCSDCKEICSICGTVFGNKHIVTCSQCGKAVCSNCSTTIGVIRRKQVCKKCEK